mmetsp:Transcript_17209/g.37030  ORF Transcript_17209/g.37030 Transcript_17209/m.37030 type:complete len:278 (-) Transcript_17209:785-1618(-)
MGNCCFGDDLPSLSGRFDPNVTLHIYDVGGHRLVKGANKVFRTIGTGAFHAGVEINGQEWSFGFCELGSGVFSCQPSQCPGHTYRECLPMGATKLSSHDVAEVIVKLTQQWQGPDYDLLVHNCCHFSAALCQALQVKRVPAWVTNLAGAGATLNKGLKFAAAAPGAVIDRAANFRIIQAAKRGEVHQQYTSAGGMRARAKDMFVKAGSGAASAVVSVGGVMANAAVKAKNKLTPGTPNSQKSNGYTALQAKSETSRSTPGSPVSPVSPLSPARFYKG